MNEIGVIKYRLEQGYTMTRYGSKDAMIEQLITDTEYLLSKVENNDDLDLVSNCLTIKKSEADEYNTSDSGGQFHGCKCGNDYLFENYNYCPKCGAKLTFV